jgi:predicted protein tyrosine phosphatase
LVSKDSSRCHSKLDENKELLAVIVVLSPFSKSVLSKKRHREKKMLRICEQEERQLSNSTKRTAPSDFLRTE